MILRAQHMNKFWSGHLFRDLGKAGVNGMVFERKLFASPHVGESLVPSILLSERNLGGFMDGNSKRVVSSALAGLICVTLCATSLFAQGVTNQVDVIYELAHDTSAALRDIKPTAYNEAALAPRQSALTQSTASVSPATATRVGTTTVLNFEGLSHTGWSSPDTNGSVGATQFVQFVNTQFAVYNKTTGAKTFGPVLGTTIFTGFGGLCETNNGGDVIVLYDKAAQRWVMSQRAVQPGGPFYQCVAVSTTSDATGSWNRYAFALTTDFPDYPKLGIWPDAYYVAINRLNTTTLALIGGLACALDRSKMLTGATATAQCINLSINASSLLPSDWDGATAPPAGAPNYFLALGTNSLNRWKFHVDFLRPLNTTLTGPTPISVPAFNQACNGGVCLPQPGTTQLIDSLGDRLMYRLAYRNFGTHESLVVTHSIVTAAGNVAIRWYEVRNPGGSPTVFQKGNFVPDTSTYRWLGSMAMDKVGDIAVGYSVSSKTVNPSIRYTGRVPTDPLGTMEGEATIMAGTGVETGSNNWGDYSSMSIDPLDDCTFWYTNEYYKTTGNGTWNTRIFAFRFPSCH
jgi:hypothetical protein